MATGRRRGEYIRYDVGHQRTLYLSAGVAGVLGERVDVYECQGVFALVNAPKGECRVQSKENSRAKLIHAQQLVNYLNAKLPGKTRSVLPAWVDGEHGALLFSARRRGQGFSDGFRKVDLTAVHFLRCGVERERLLVPRWLPLRCNPYTDGGQLLLKKEEAGVLRRTEWEGKACYRSRQLVEYVRREWGEDGVFYRRVPQGVLLSNNCATLMERAELPQALMPLPMVEEGSLLELCRDRSIHISPAAQSRLGSRASLYMSKRGLALRTDRKGELHIRSFAGGGTIFNLGLYALLLSFYPMAMQIQLRPWEDFLVLDGELQEEEMVSDQFFQVRLGDGAAILSLKKGD